MDFLPPALHAMNSYKNFIVYKLEASASRPGKTDKFPVDPETGSRKINHLDKNNHMVCIDAHAAALRLGENYGVGFVFTAEDPFFFIDIDNCLTEDGQWHPLAMSILTVFQGAAVEVSTSGKGLHIFGTGTVPAHGCVYEEAPIKMEFYHEKRFVALTGANTIGDANFDCTQALTWLTKKYFSKTTGAIDSDWWSIEPHSDWSGPTDDEALLSLALKSASAKALFGDGATFRDLWENNLSVLTQTYYDPQRDDKFDQSRADMALAQHLAFWTGNNAERILTLMQRSALPREKWNRPGYLRETIRKACARQNTFCNRHQSAEIAAPVTPSKIRLLNEKRILTPDEQINYFADCVYITDENKILVPGGQLLDQARFRVAYGSYTFMLDNINQKVTRNAWEAFTESQAIDINDIVADSSSFKPDKPFGEIYEHEGTRFANTYWPIITPQIPGDLTPFYTHLEKLFPDAKDREFIINYMAACVQMRGVKFQCCPIIQGVQGNGKTLLTRCVAYAVGYRYTHFPLASDIANKFNDWLYGTIFIGLEEMYTPVQRDSSETIENMKVMITNERQEIQPKGGKKVTREICCNFIINTNHKDGLRKTEDDRRFAPFYTPQQSLADLRRCGMTGGYFPRLYKWLREGGYAHISHMLHTHNIPQAFKDLICDRAPVTTSTAEAIREGLGGLEQEILEAVATATPGFKDGWISSHAVGLLLERLRRQNFPHNKRRAVIESLGYKLHPGLSEGRSNAPVFPDGVKSRLYIKDGHAALELKNPADIAKAYSAAQGADVQ